MDARGDDDYLIHLTSPIAEIDVAREDDWKKQQNKEKKRKKKRPNTVVRPDWPPQDHSLAALLAAHSGVTKKVQVVAANKPHVIDLAEPLGDSWPSLAP